MDRLGTDEKWALITGASSGIGRALAHAFAARGYNLLLSARNESRLRQVAADCSVQFKIKADIYATDLSESRGVDDLIGAIGAAQRSFEVLVNNAGFGVHGQFRSTAINQELSLVGLQLDTTLKLTKALLPGMLSRRSGRILNVASLYSFAPVPFQSVYAASKAFVLSFSAALSAELQGTGVSVSVLCPGVTQSEFRYRAGIPEPNKTAGATAERVAEIAVREALQGRLIVVPGFFNKAFVFLARRLPIAGVLRFVKFINQRRGVHD
jgi:uncharacterized protein